ncbi:MAG: hypothetical protein AMJ79_07555 [Phycisphaerae bacterium SM23_30]|nr:MAG: hypothetical protein AMJ79_07555 [Phycisphaerae bacterium SM23_30]
MERDLRADKLNIKVWQNGSGACLGDNIFRFIYLYKSVHLNKYQGVVLPGPTEIVVFFLIFDLILLLLSQLYNDFNCSRRKFASQMYQNCS